MFFYISIIYIFVDIIRFHKPYRLRMPSDNDRGHVWLHGTYICFLIITSHVLISFLSFQIHRHAIMPIVRSPTVR
jgi:hypothetical protein